MADIVASVPELTRRTFSTLGTISTIFSAIWISSSVGAPKPRLAVDCSRTASTTGANPCPWIMGPQEPT